MLQMKATALKHLKFAELMTPILHTVTEEAAGAAATAAERIRSMSTTCLMMSSRLLCPLCP